MTGFGRAEAQLNDYRTAVEIKTVNNRYLEISAKISPSLYQFEVRAKEIIRDSIGRGRVFLTLNDLSPRLRFGEIRLDESLCRALLQHLREISKNLGLDGEITLDNLIPFAEYLHSTESTGAAPELMEAAETALKSAVEELTEMRRAEGKALKEDFLSRLQNIETGVEKCKSLAEMNPQRKLERLKERIAELLRNNELDPFRLEMEAVILMDKLDITEELVRLKSHCGQFRKILEDGSPCGRRFNFLIQEMHRELNTSSAKADMPELSHLVVEMKEELEKMREQSQNVE